MWSEFTGNRFFYVAAAVNYERNRKLHNNICKRKNLIAKLLIWVGGKFFMVSVCSSVCVCVCVHFLLCACENKSTTRQNCTGGVLKQP